MRVLAYAILVCTLFAAPASAQAIRVQIDVQADQPGPTIDPNIYGHFVEHLGRGVYEGIWVGEDSSIPNVRGIRTDVVEALRRIRAPLVRWPGGCFAEIYHWRDGIGPREQRPMSVNSAWGDEAETNAFGTHEFMDFIEQIGAKPFISVNVTSGSPGEAQAWMQYMTGPANSGPGRERAANGREEPWEVPFIGIGNETWGCGGNMTAAYYADLYRHYLSVLQPYGQLIVSDANSDDYEWTETILERALYRHANPTTLAYISRAPQIRMMSIHFYAFAGNDWGAKSPAVGFSEHEWALSIERAGKMDEIITRHSEIMDRYDPQRRIGLSISEWGTWWRTDPTRPSNLYQVTTLRDAVIAGHTLNIFHNHAERVRMANIAQLVNVLQAMILTRGEEMIVTPTYHVFDLFQAHQGATLIPTRVQTPDYQSEDVSLPAISASASRGQDGVLRLSLVNLDPSRAANIAAQIHGYTVAGASARMITANTMDAHPDFGAADLLAPQALEGIQIGPGQIGLTIPAKSVVMVELRS